MTFRFLHSSDLHLGKPFGGYPEAIRNRLREARHGAIGRLAGAARDTGASVILLAGDTFDAETPAPETLRHALRAMAAAPDLTWVMLPGNHDSLAASELWQRLAAEAPDNLRVITEARPLELGPGAWLLPAPCTQRRPGRDLTEAMAAPTPEGMLRIGLGHGAVTDFSGEEGTPGILAPDRAERSGLDYLALGDWHGCLSITPRTWYSGAPERDGFKHAGPGTALAVTLAGGPPQVQWVAIGAFAWTVQDLSLLPGDDPIAVLDGCLPPVAQRRDTLLNLSASGRLPLSDRQRLDAELTRLAPDFGWFAADLSGLATETQPDDLDRIDRGGALRQAAEALRAEAETVALDPGTRATAAAALARLYALAQEAQG